MNETAINIFIGAALILALFFNGYMKYQRSKNQPLGRVATVLGDINRNVKLVENFTYHNASGRMKTGNWARNKDKIVFLPQEMRVTLGEVFEMMEEVNGRIDAGKKFKSDSYMAGIDLSKLKEPLAKVKEQLTEWLRANMNNPEYQQKKRGLLSGLFK
ncbi:hypothetical protein ACFLWU_06700 [Chloroflexota bacterium]